MEVGNNSQKFGAVGMVLLMVVASCLFFACQKKELTGPQYKVLLINSYHFDYAHSSNSVQLYRDCFAEKGVNVDLRNIFLEFPYGVADKQWEECILPKLDSLAGWLPDLILLNNDFAVQVATLNPDWLRRFPVVYGGVVAPDSMLLDFFPNMTGFVCPPDYMANLRFIEKVTGQKEAVMELDYAYTDSLRRLHLQAAGRNFPEGYGVVTVSAASPNRNVSGDSTGVAGKLYLEEMYRQAKYKVHLQTMADSYSNLIMNHSGLPQFTATDVQFANGDARFVGGYFPSLETQVRDQVDYAVRILHGALPKDLPRMMHKSQYFMDYEAMLRRGLDYNDWKNQATILNVPYRVQHPIGLALQVVIGLLVICLFTWLLVKLYIFFSRRHINRMLADLQRQKDRRSLLLASSQSYNWVLKNGIIHVDEHFAKQWKLKSNSIDIVTFANFVHEDCIVGFHEFLAKKDRLHNFVSLKLSFDDGQTWHWFDMNYKVLVTQANEVLLGLMMNMDDQRKAEDQLLRAQEAAEQVEMKEMFLANMNHDIRTPLAAIAGFAEVITDMGEELDDESMQSYSEIISQNSEILLKLVDDVLNMRGDDLGKFRYYPKVVKVDDLIAKAFKTNQVLCPQNLDFRMLKGKEGLTIHVDFERTMQVINNFLSNAFKCTPSGYVALGWQYTEVTGEVELFVIDTGIGISVEQQRNLFDRYYKADEEHRGTGLGLHISKMLVEDQQGHIDVRSSVGMGSRFSAFFKVCRMLLLLLGFGFSMVSCRQKPLQQHGDGRDFRVAVVHSYDAMLEDYVEFNEVLDSKFHEEDLSVQISTFYLDLVDVDVQCPTVQQTLDSLVQLKPDVILMDDDLGVMTMLATDHSILHETPVVVGGLTLADWNMQYNFPLLTGFESPIDYPRNIEMGKELWDMNLVEIELDHTSIDSLRRQKLAASIARPPFANNSDLHLRDLGWENLKEGELKDSIVVMVVSLRSPELNVEKVPNPDNPIEDAIAYTRNLQIYGYAYPQIVVKHDYYSNSMFDPYRRPEVTAVRTDFGTSAALYLGGYFATTRTVASDMGGYAAEILKGTPVAKLAPAVHESAYYIDYNALRRFSSFKELDYRDLINKGYILINQPYRILHPYRFYGIPAFAVMLVMLVVVYFTIRSSRRRNQELATLRLRMEHEIEMGNMVLDNFKGTVFSYRHGQLTMDESFMKRNKFDVVTLNDEQFRSFIHPQHMQEYDQLMESFQVPGTYDHHIFIKYMQDETYHWLLMHYVVKAPGEVDGFSMMDDLAVMRELKLQTARRQMKMVTAKTEFLNNVSFLVRGPLSSVLGFSEQLSKNYQEFTAEERKEFCQIIRETSHKLLDTVNQVLELSRVESGRAEIKMESIDPKLAVDNVYTRWHYRMSDKPDVRLIYHPGREGLLIKINAIRLESVFDLLMKRAFDTTDKGTVTIGWFYDLKACEVIFYVEDTGNGMEMAEEHDVFRQSSNLDLALAYSVITHMNGHIDVQSQVGVGTRFQIRFTEITPPPIGEIND